MIREPGSEERKRGRSLKREIREVLLIFVFGGTGLLLYFRGLTALKTRTGLNVVALLLLAAGGLLVLMAGFFNFLFDYGRRMGFRKGLRIYLSSIAFSILSAFIISRLLMR